jgi:hypothetical protein
MRLLVVGNGPEVSDREAGIRPSSEPGPERPGAEGAESGEC